MHVRGGGFARLGGKHVSRQWTACHMRESVYVAGLRGSVGPFRLVSGSRGSAASSLALQLVHTDPMPWRYKPS